MKLNLFINRLQRCHLGDHHLYSCMGGGLLIEKKPQLLPIPCVFYSGLQETAIFTV